MNIYLKHIGIWLGGTLALAYILPYLSFYSMANFFSFLGVIAATVIAMVKIHSELGTKIEFSKAIGPILLMHGGYTFLLLITFFFENGFDFFSFLIPYILTTFFLGAVMSTAILLAVGAWYMFEKAGRPGWAAIIPIYNLIVLCEIGDRPTWYVAMMLVPIANIIFIIKIMDGVSKAFGKDDGFTVGLFFLRQIFFAILGFGDDEYKGKKVLSAASNDTIIDDI